MSYPSISRREFLRLLALAGSRLFVSCNQQSAPALTNLPHTPGPIPPTYPSAVPTGFHTTPTPTQAPPVNLREKINTVVILLDENHSFDSLFAGYPGVNGKAAPNKCPDAIQHFMREGGTSIENYCSYTEQQVPNYWKLALTFTLCDNYYSEVRGPSFPNYMMLTSAQTTVVSNPKPPYECPNYIADVISPYAKAGAVVHTEFSHVSTLRTVESIFDITALNDRDATANDLFECLDFTQAPIAPFTLSERRCSS